MTGIFTRYVVFLGIGILAAAGIVMLVLQALAYSGSVLPANYYERQIEDHRDQIAESADIKSLIPRGCLYGVYDESGNFLEGNMEENLRDTAYHNAANGANTAWDYFIKTVPVKGGTCVILYKIAMSFTNPALQKYLPNPLLCLAVIFILLTLGIIIWLSRRFGKLLSREIAVLERTTENIRMEELNFEMESSDIKEISNVLDSFLQLRKNLKHSLEQQWKLEESRRDQVAALSHDLKTPLTILRGNAELLSETDLDEEQQIYSAGILHSAADMQDYIRMLLDISSAHKALEILPKQTNPQVLLNGAVSQAKILVMEKSICLEADIGNLPEQMALDESAFSRAVMNAVTNAVEYTPVSGKIKISACEEENHLAVCVEDSGRGFSEEETKRAFEQFYQGDKSRNSKLHYGMGLFIAKSVAEAHGGGIELGRSSDLGGARVRMIF